ncbi:nucleotide-diphospho-sugar transferase [Dunaliella salina]|uniref:Nucleotide-diphospho-sugar transferase n=1 Tax=Dunaliella salina TaxID=3046 RepID=A0ABQ7GPQ4_DUNSA|nr:nucleotide-diphospho-sugar transferase [Dunaliella salina]|eukprot:KAF5836581.1 nucleotide-diphospho-sugar transferase [Dunaliella salina]
MLWLLALLAWALVSTFINKGAEVSSPQPREESLLAYTLLLSGEQNPDLLENLDLIRQHLLPWTPGHVLLFHTGAYEAAAKQAPLLEVLPTAKFLRIPDEAWTLPPGLKEEDVVSWAFAPCCPYPTHGIGYRHMCRWYSNGLFKYLAARGYAWVLRLDEDSKVLSPAKTDLVAWMKQNGKHYGYRLWAFLLDSCLPRALPGLNSFGGWDRKVIYTNFFLVDISWWMTEKVQAYLEVIEKSHGHYLYRWGDAAVHTMVVKTFLQRSQTHLFGFAYQHKENQDMARGASFLRVWDAMPP